jgi:hypothetical protein
MVILFIILQKHLPVNTPDKKKKYSFRISLRELEQAKRVARAHGVTLTDLIHLRLRNLPIPDRTEQQERFTAIHTLTQELQYIGHNINQVTTAIHRANIRRNPIAPELQSFNQLLATYLSSRDQLKTLLEQYLYP